MLKQNFQDHMFESIYFHVIIIFIVSRFLAKAPETTAEGPPAEVSLDEICEAKYVHTTIAMHSGVC